MIDCSSSDADVTAPSPERCLHHTQVPEDPDPALEPESPALPEVTLDEHRSRLAEFERRQELWRRAPYVDGGTLGLRRTSGVLFCISLSVWFVAELVLSTFWTDLNPILYVSPQTGYPMSNSLEVFV